MIHNFECNGNHIVLDVNSGAIHCTDKLCYDILGLYETAACLPKTPDDAVFSLPCSKEDVLEAYGELLELQSRGELFSEDTLSPLAGMLREAPIKSMCLNVAHDCNLRCDYCFASKGDFGKGKKLMPLAVGRAAIDFLLAHSGTRRNLEVDFFGGEPLMNIGAVKDIVRYARSRERDMCKRFRFTITTNGLLLNTDTIDFINSEMSNVVLSLDGRPAVHDKFRKTISGHGSHHIITEKFKELLNRRGYRDYYVRGTYTRENLDFTNDVLWLYGQGFDQISLEPVVSDENLPYAIRESDLPEIFAEYEKLTQTLLELRQQQKSATGQKPLNFFHFKLDLANGPCAVRRLRGCSSGNEYIAVTPEGDIYPCHQFVGQDEWQMGNVLTGAFDAKTKETFAEVSIYTKEACTACWAKFFCSGGCNANNHLYQGSILTPHPLTCSLEKKRLECAVGLALP